jgi:hypothetical protein
MHIRQSWTKLRAAVRGWWDGEYIKFKDDPFRIGVIIGGVTYRHWTSEWAHTILGFLKREWKWVAGFVVTVAGLCIAFARLP